MVLTAYLLLKIYTKRFRLKRILFAIFLILATILIVLFVTSRSFFIYYSLLFSIQKPFLNILNEAELLELKSDCSCRKTRLIVYKNKNIIYVNSSKDTFSSFFVPYSFSNLNSKLEKINCDLYNVLLRGPKQKVIGLSLYGNEPYYSTELRTISEQAKKYYPGWVLRIHYDDSIDRSIICQLECLENNNIDFCYVEKIPYGAPLQTWSARHMHKMTWRWLPIGDFFVDYFMSRDSDSWITDRENDSVSFWLQSNKLFHIIRDHPKHGVPVLGGLWGYVNKLDRQIGYKMLSIITHNGIAKQYLPDGISVKGLDQDLLENYFWRIMRKNAVIHDSYSCKKLGGEGFPTKRPDPFCYISCKYCCESKHTNQTNYVCPIECRPKNHKEWIYC